MTSFFESHPIISFILVYILIGLIVSLIRMYIFYVKGEDFSLYSDEEGTALSAFVFWPVHVGYGIASVICLLARKLSAFYIRRNRK